MTALDDANLRISSRIDGLRSGTSTTEYTVRLVRAGAYDGPAYWSHQLNRYMASRLWLILRRERRWDVIVEKASTLVWRSRCPDREAAINLGVRIAERVRATGGFTPP